MCVLGEKMLASAKVMLSCFAVSQCRRKFFFFEWRNAVTETIKSLNTNITDLSNGFLSQLIAQLPSGWSCSPKVVELPVRVRGMSK